MCEQTRLVSRHSPPAIIFAFATALIRARARTCAGCKGASQLACGTRTRLRIGVPRTHTHVRSTEARTHRYRCTGTHIRARLLAVHDSERKPAKTQHYAIDRRGMRARARLDHFSLVFLHSSREGGDLWLSQYWKVLGALSFMRLTHSNNAARFPVYPARLQRRPICNQKMRLLARRQRPGLCSRIRGMRFLIS